MTNQSESSKLAEKATQRDPREAPFGFYSGGPFVLDSLRMFSWFDDIEAMIASMLEVQPVFYGLDMDMVRDFQAEVSPHIDSLRKDGFSEELLGALNETACFMCIDWWGTFEDLWAGDTEFARNIRADFHSFSDDDEETEITEPVNESQVEEFVEFLSTYGI